MQNIFPRRQGFFVLQALKLLTESPSLRPVPVVSIMNGLRSENNLTCVWIGYRFVDKTSKQEGGKQAPDSGSDKDSRVSPLRDHPAAHHCSGCQCQGDEELVHGRIVLYSE